MVKGLAIFREKFREYSDQYLLIGGTACDLVMTAAGLEFRATKDLDIVLCIEALDTAFIEAFWAFVREGNYQLQQKAEGGKQFYRFQKPRTEGFPFMLELFSRSPESLPVAQGSHLTPIPTAEEVSSLSAILMDAEYYDFVRSATRDIDGLPVVGPEGLIPLKARAWLDLTERKAKGDAIDSRDIKKHKNDVFRLYQIVDPEAVSEIPEAVKTDMAMFVTRVASEEIDLKALGIGKVGLESILIDLRKLYGID
jgi:hypothetical protein